MTQLRLSLLGPPQVWAGETSLTFATRKALALLIYLAVEGDPQPRDKLLALLWPDSTAERGRGVLRTTLAYLRRPLDAAYLLFEADTVAFNFQAGLDLDLHRVTAALQSPQLALLEKAAQSHRGDFLEGFSLPDAPTFDEWATVQREHWHRQMSRVFDLLTQQQAAGRQLEAALTSAARWVVHDPLNETAHRSLMRLHGLAGDRSAALQAYAACQTTLKTELGLDPSAETKALAEQIRRDTATRRQDDRVSGDHGSSLSPRHPSIPFVGRSAEHARLSALYQQVRQGRTQVGIIEGEAGIGKTRLAAEFLNWLAFQGADIVRGRAFEAGGRLAYQPVVEAVRERLEQENAPDDLLPDVWLAELSRLLPELRDRYPDLPPPTADEALAQTRLLEALARLGLALAARRPLVFFIDDIQWADTASLDVLSYLGHTWAERGAAVLLLLSLRSEALLTAPALSEWLSNLARDAPLTRLAVGPLSAKETQQLVENLQGSRGAETQGRTFTGSPADFAAWLFNETAGQPFYITETIKMLLEQGFIHSRTEPEGRSLFDFAGEIPAGMKGGKSTAPLIPPGVRQVILARLKRLTPNAAALLTAAAVMGRQCSFERLCQVAALLENEALAALDELLLGRLLLEAGQSARPYTVAHDKIRDVVYTEAGDARRRVFHRRAFEALELKSAPPGELAHHALAAQLTESAIIYSIAAGDEAMRLFAIRDAVVHYEQAQALATGDRGPGIGQRLIQNLHHLHLQLGRAYELTSAWEKARAGYQALLTLAQELHAPETECAALNRLANLAAQLDYDIDQAATYLQQAIHVAESCGDQVALAEAEWNLAQITVFSWDMEGSMTHARRALALARQLALPELTARSLTVLAFAECGAAGWLEGDSHYEEARHLYAGLGNRALEAECLCGMVRARANLGQAAAAVDLGRTAHALNLENDNTWGQAVSALNLGFVLLESSEWSEALAIAQTGVAKARIVSGFAPLPILNLTVLGNTYRAMLDLDAAQAAHREAVAISESRPYQPLLRMTAEEMCVDCAMQGNWTAAYRYACQSLAAHNHSLLHGGLHHWYVTEALLHGGDVDLARSDVQRFGQQFGHSPRYQLTHRRCLAVLAQREGDLEQAVAHLEAADNLAEEIGLPGEQWSILAALGVLYRLRGEETRAGEAMIRLAEIAQALAARIEDNAMRVGFLENMSRLSVMVTK